MSETKHYAIVFVVDSEKMKHEDVEAYVFQAVKTLILTNYSNAVSECYLDEFYSETPSEPPEEDQHGT